MFSIEEVQPMVAFADSRKVTQQVLKVLKRIAFLGKAWGPTWCVRFASQERTPFAPPDPVGKGGVWACPQPGPIALCFHSPGSSPELCLLSFYP